MLKDLVRFSYYIFEVQDLFLPAKCIVHFRPKKDWKGEDYGFDWMRLGDTNMFGDAKHYKNIIAKQYHNSSTNIDSSGRRIARVGDIITDINQYKGNFTLDNNVYNTLKMNISLY